MSSTTDPGRPGVIVADDQPDVREMLAAWLAREGFAVFQAGTGEQAVALVAGRPGGIDAALLDCQMPGMGGPAALAELRRLKPGLPGCLMTGWADDPGALLAAGADRVLSKPFTPDQAAEALREVLRGRR
jgi:CheY-like chemotaxis protein